MVTKVFGKIIENTYRVDNKLKIYEGNGEFKEVYTGKPELVKESNVKEWIELCSFNGEHRYNFQYPPSFNCSNEFNISENETVKEEKEIFRADLNEVHVFTNKVIREFTLYEKIYTDEYNHHITNFNKMMIESNERMKLYCDLHKLAYGETDCIELFTLLYPECYYCITEDGKMIARKNTEV